MSEVKEKEIDRAEIIKRTINKEITQTEAANELGVTDRQVRRIIKSYLINGEKAFIHGNCDNQHAKKISEDISSEIVNIYLDEYSDYNFTHFCEERRFKFGVSYSYIVNIFNENEIISPLAQHKTVKLYNKNMESAIRNKTITEHNRSCIPKESKKN